MNQGCHGAMVEMFGICSISHWVETGFVVSGVEATSIRSTSSSTISSFATSAARFGFDWLSFTTTSRSIGAAAGFDRAFGRFHKALDVEIVGGSESGERAALRRHVAELDRCVLRMDGGREERRRGERLPAAAADVFRKRRRSIVACWIFSCTVLPASSCFGWLRLADDAKSSELDAPSEVVR